MGNDEDEDEEIPENLKKLWNLKIQQLHDPDPHRKLGAIQALVYYPNIDSIKELLPILRDESLVLRSTARDSLKRIFFELDCEDYKDLLLTEIFMGNTHSLLKETLKKCLEYL